MHDTYKRLLLAGRMLRGWRTASEIAGGLTTLGYEVSSQQMTNWKTRGLSKDALLKIPSLLLCRPEWLATGQGEMTYEANTGPPHHVSSAGMDLTKTIKIHGKVPLIAWVNAGRFKEVIDQHEPSAAEEWIDTTVPVREHTFALRIEGDSMEPVFPAGVIIIVEPELDAAHGDYVIVRNSNNEATFKQLIRDGDDWLLKPLNPRYPIKPLTAQDAICGVVRALELRFK